MHIHGDWMKGQWRANGKVLGEDFNCINLPGTKALAVTVDGLGILGAAWTRRAARGGGGIRRQSSSTRRSTPSSRSVKGSTPVRIDAPADKLDACNKLVLESLKKPDFWVLNPYYISDADWINSVWNTMFTFQGDPDMTTDDVIEMLRQEYEAIF